MLLAIRWAIRTLLLATAFLFVPAIWLGFLGAAWIGGGHGISAPSPLELYNSAFQHYMSGEAFGPLDDFANKD